MVQSAEGVVPGVVVGEVIGVVVGVVVGGVVAGGVTGGGGGGLGTPPAQVPSAWRVLVPVHDKHWLGACPEQVRQLTSHCWHANCPLREVIK